MRTYAQMTTLILQMLQDTGAATYDSTETGFWTEESLKEFAKYDPHLVDVIFQVESRTGSDDAGTASSLTDAAKSQFVSSDATEEKVVHNTNDNTWAVILSNSSTSVNTLSADIMDTGENYNIYNKRCKNNKQIYIGDVTDYILVDSVEYPIGTPRNFRVYYDVLEIDADSIQDSDPTLDPLNDLEVLVRFAKPHRLIQLTDVDGEVDLGAGYAKGVKTMHVDELGSTEVIEIGDEFHLENKRYLYTITAKTPLSSNEGDITFFPGLEDAVIDNDDINFITSTLKPQHEELFGHLVAARSVLSDNVNFINKVNVGDPGAWRDWQTWGERKLAEVIGKMESLSPPKTKRRYPTA